MKRLAVLLCFLAACASARPEARSTATSTPTAGTDAFLAEAHNIGRVGDVDYAVVDDSHLLRLGNAICDDFSNQSYGAVVQELVEATPSVSSAQAATLIRSAVRNLCPEYSNRVP